MPMSDVFHFYSEFNDQERFKLNAVRIETNNIISTIEETKKNNKSKKKRDKKASSKKSKFNKSLLEDIIDSKSLSKINFMSSTHSNSTSDTIDISSKSSSA